MILNHIKIAIRNVVKNRMSSFINIVGLTLGITAATFIWQYVSFERSYDSFHAKSDRIYRIPASFYKNGVLEGQEAMNSAPAGPALMKEFPEVEAFLRVTPEYGRTVFRYGDKLFEEQKIFYTDSNFFEFFDHKILYGDPETALIEPFSIILTKGMAERYFGSAHQWRESPVGQVLKVNNIADFKITGIIEDLGENTHLKFNAIISFTTFPITNGDPTENWFWNDFYTYVLLNDADNSSGFLSKLDGFADRHVNQNQPEGFKVTYDLQNLRDIHLYSDLGYEAEPNGDAKTVYFLLLIAVAILSIAWANYINLTTARAEERTKEVGIRKVLGANRKTLITQFLFEALFVNAIAILLAILFISGFQPLMNSLVGKSIHHVLTGTYLLVLLPLAILLAGTLVSGIYPAVVLSSLLPGRHLKTSNQKRQALFRKGLVTFQYISSIILIVSTLIIYKQLEFMKNSNLGFSIDQKLVVNAPSVYRDSAQMTRYAGFKNILLRNPKVESVTASSAIPGKYYYDLDIRGGVRMRGADVNENAAFTSYRIDEDYFSTYGIKIIAGRNFSKESTADDGTLAVNEAALRLLGISSPDEAIGQYVRFQSDERMLPITAVFEDYHHKSLKHDFEPMILWNFIPDPWYYTIKYNVANTSELRQLVTSVENTWKRAFPDNPFHFFFFDEQFNEQYEGDGRLARIVLIFSLFAVFIACLGLFGLTSFMVSKRTKEIGIRKVLGASTQNIIKLLSADFIYLVLVALVLAIPVSLYLGAKWLENFAHHMEMEWWIFLVAGIISLGVAFLTVFFQSAKAAMTNPVESLRDE